MPGSITRPTLWLLVLSVLPLSMALRWAAIYFPISTNEYFIRAVWVDDRFVVVQFEYYPYRYGMFRSHQCVFREYLVDCKANIRTELVGSVSEPDYWPALPEIAPDGTIVRLFHKEHGWKHQRINPQTLESRTQPVGTIQPTLVGSRFLISLAWDEAADHGLLLWRDLLEEAPRVHSVPFETYGGNLEPVEGANSFCLLPNAENLQWYDEETRETHTEVDWFDELLHSDKLRPPPLPAFQNDIEMLLLFSMSEHGPEFVGRWPVVGGSGLVTRQMSGGYISSLRIDAATIDVRSAATGKITLSVPVPIGALPADFRPSWRMSGTTLTLVDTTGTALQTFDASSGTVIPTDGALHRLVYDQSKSYYVTVRHADLSKRENWPPVIQVRERRSGNIAQSFQIDASYWQSLRFTSDETILKCVDESGRAMFIDTSSGDTRRLVDPTKHHAGIGICIGLAAAVWGGLFFFECRRANVPMLARSIVLTIATLSFTTYRLSVSGHDQFFERLAWQVNFGLALAWGLGVVLWLVNSRIQLPYRLLGAGAILTIYYVIGGRMIDSGWAFTLTAYHVVFASFLLIVAVASMRCFGWLPSSQRPEPGTAQKLTIRVLFLWMTLVALILGGATRVDWGESLRFLTFSRAWPLVLDCSLRVLVAIATWWSIRHIHRRATLGGITILISLAVSITIHTFVISKGFDPLYLAEGVWYASCQFVTLACIVALGFVNLRRCSMEPLASPRKRAFLRLMPQRHQSMLG